MSNIDDTLKERGSQHGKFVDNAEMTEKILGIIRHSPNYIAMPALVKVGIWHIVHKLARACCGDFKHKDHWHDIGGYSKLIEDYVAPQSKSTVHPAFVLATCNCGLSKQPDPAGICYRCNLPCK